MKRSAILVVGAGELGSRHLQALAQLREPAELAVVEPDPGNRQRARNRFSEIAGHERHHWTEFKSLESLRGQVLDVAIVATGADVRHEVVKGLMDGSAPRFLILEKVLFQRIEDYSEVDQLLDSARVHAFVNCPRRLFGAYRRIREVVGGRGPWRMEVVGNQWGLACNAVHFIDLFQFLTGRTVNRWQGSLSAPEPSKRAGHIEFYGSLEAQDLDEAALSLTCYQGGSANLSVRISTPTHRFIIDETRGDVRHDRVTPSGVDADTDAFRPEFQSQLSHRVVEDLLEKGRCGLTPYRHSMASHVPLLDLMLEHYNRYQAEPTDRCPIT